MKKILLAGIILGIMIFLAGQISALDFNQTVTVTIINGTEITDETYFPFCVFETTNVTLIANVTFKDCFGDVWVSVKAGSGNWTNYSVDSFMGSNYSFVLDSSLISGGDTVYWKYYAKDCYNHTYNGSEQSFYVIAITQLTVNPASPDGLNGWYVSEPVFTLTKDPFGNNTYYRWDSIENWLYTLPFGLENIPNAPPKESAGTLDLNYWTEFGLCGNESEQTSLFYVDLTNPKFKDLQPVGHVFNNLRPLISVYIDEIYQSNSGINKNSVVMKLDGNPVNASVNDADSIDVIASYVPDSDLSEGWHNVSIYAEDNAGRSNQTFWEFNINITPVFDFNVYFPADGIYDSKRISFNMTSSEKLDEIEYINWNDKNPRWKRLCINCDEYGFSRKRTKNLKEGLNNITIRATDVNEQVKDINVSLFIDSKNPRISRISPRRNSVSNGSEFYVKFIEDNPVNLSINFNPSVEMDLNECIISKSYKECSIDLDLTGYEGEWIEYYFNLEDIAGNKDESRSTRIKVDTISPSLTVNLPENKTGNQSYGRRVQFNITVSEDVRLEYIDNSDLSPRWRRLCTRCNEYGSNRIKTKSFKKGIHNILIRAVDKAGNSDIKEVGFEVDY